MKTLIIGGNGKIGKKLVAECNKLGMDIRVMVRNTEQYDYFTALGIEAVLGDLEGDISQAFTGCEQVIFTAGSGSGTTPHKTLLVDLWGSIRAVDESVKQGIERFIMVSSLKADQPLRGPEKIRHYLVARNLADDRLIRSNLNYTLLRPGRLLDSEGTGLITSEFDWADSNNAQSVISRDDVVSVILQVMQGQLDEFSNQTFDFINGDTPINFFLAERKEALA
ncbi:SDR family oxidoreductase [Catenovulum sp. SX2]|uniref:SDR family oxidoreductase n=1 Tax=Catenovulum sp. SX2 TaxID=3398614 RepID=UPI003F875E0C